MHLGRFEVGWKELKKWKVEQAPEFQRISGFLLVAYDRSVWPPCTGLQCLWLPNWFIINVHNVLRQRLREMSKNKSIFALSPVQKKRGRENGAWADVDQTVQRPEGDRRCGLWWDWFQGSRCKKRGPEACNLETPILGLLAYDDWAQRCCDGPERTRMSGGTRCSAVEVWPPCLMSRKPRLQELALTMPCCFTPGSLAGSSQEWQQNSWGPCALDLKGPLSDNQDVSIIVSASFFGPTAEL